MAIVGRVGEHGALVNVFREAAWELASEDPALFDVAGRFLAAGAYESAALAMIPAGFHLSGLRYDPRTGWWFAIVGGPVLVASNPRRSSAVAILEACLLAAAGCEAMKV